MSNVNKPSFSGKKAQALTRVKVTRRKVKKLSQREAYRLRKEREGK